VGIDILHLLLKK